MTFRGAVALLAIAAILFAAAVPGLWLAICVTGLLALELSIERRREDETRRPCSFGSVSPRASRAPPLVA